MKENIKTVKCGAKKGNRKRRMWKKLKLKREEGGGSEKGEHMQVMKT